MSDLSGMIENAMGDPRFAGILESLKEKADSGELDVASLLGDLTKNERTEEAVKPAKKPSMDNHKKLLAALKPYLANEKQGAVDSLLKIGEFSGIIEALSKNKSDGR